MIVVSLGGSLINPGAIDVDFLKKLKQLIHNSKERFILVCGGGKPARDYMSAAAKLSVKIPDWVGIEATKLNATLISSLFTSNPKVYMEPKRLYFKKVLCACGWKPGCSTDLDAVLWAEIFDSNVVYNLTNVDYVFNKNPSDPEAVPLKNISWIDYLKMFRKFSSGMHAPFDPVAAKRSYKKRMKVIVLNGKKLNNFKNAFSNQGFVGTVIE